MRQQNILISSLLIIFCLIKVETLSIEKNKRKNNKQIVSKVVGTFTKRWNGIALHITNLQNEKSHQQILFDAKIFCRKSQDQNIQKCFGIQFKMQNITYEEDHTNFVQNVLQMENSDNDEEPMPVLDFRLVKHCYFSQNKQDFFQDKSISFKVSGDEYLSQLPTQNGPWEVKLTFLNSRNPILSLQVDQLVPQLKQMCEYRKNKIENLKQQATFLGDQYYQDFASFQKINFKLEQAENEKKETQKQLDRLQDQLQDDSNTVYYDMEEIKKKLLEQQQTIEQIEQDEKTALQNHTKLTKDLNKARHETIYLKILQQQLKEDLQAMEDKISSKLSAKDIILNTEQNAMKQISDLKQNMNKISQQQKDQITEMEKEIKDYEKHIQSFDEQSQKYQKLIRQNEKEVEEKQQSYEKVLKEIEDNAPTSSYLIELAMQDVLSNQHHVHLEQIISFVGNEQQ